ncbi:Aste57867_15683 [Aphanomyces stellatus]|uniref:Aste57867_15683 protein n=1 Tax=Aphanomyces stellatus TaxID=120398 RepID=A0A485L400_9STRA|nr:hypothetical protein As57867_015627 [Aphanomyces stellatus]VFT92476.1 Aste57867_15683 [Aphanomyces stellatus]
MGDKIVNTLKQYDGMINEMGAYPAKHIINSLTMIAEDLTMAKHIAPFLVKKLSVVGPAYRLPILYLMDSIIKNVGGPYAYLFGQTLGPVYVDSVGKVNPTDLKRFNHVLKTWETARLFPSTTLIPMREAADAALRVAQPSDQPTSFSGVRGSTPTSSLGGRSSSAREVSAVEMQMRKLLTQLQTEDGVHPTEQLSLEEVRAQNPDLYAHLKSTCEAPPAPVLAAAPVVAPPVLGHRPPPRQQHQPTEPLLPHPHHHAAPSHGGGLLPPPQSRAMPRAADPPLRRSPPSRPPSRVHPTRQGFIPRHLQQPSHGHQHPHSHHPHQQQQSSSSQQAPSAHDVMKLLKKINAMPGRAIKASDIQVNKKRIDEHVYSLYGALPHVSTSSGLRFKDNKKLSEHMDFLFHYNRAVRERTKGGISRSWYPNEEQWSTDFCTVSNSREETSAGFVQQDVEPEMDKDELNAARVPVDASITKCRICGCVPLDILLGPIPVEPFTKCWDEDEEEWMYQNAVVGTIQTADVLPNKQTIFHKYCYDSAVASSKTKAVLPSQLAPGSPMVAKRPLEVEDLGVEDDEQENNKRLKNATDDDANAATAQVL